jgi:hypothetical protein
MRRLSRLAGHVQWVWLTIFVVSVLLLGFAGVRVWMIAVDWRWRLGCLAAIWTAEAAYTPPFNPAPWPADWSADRFIANLNRSRFLIEMTSLTLLPEKELDQARQLADEARVAAVGLVEAVPTGIGEDLRPWVVACEVKHLAERTLTLTKDWHSWEQRLPGEGTIAGELMSGCASAFEVLAEPIPTGCV